MLSEISHRLFSKELNFVFEFFFALCQKSLALEVGWSKQSGFCMVIFVNLVWTITSNLDMILGCNLLRIVYNYFYFKKIPTFCFQSSWLLWNLSLKRAPQPNFYGFHMICPFFLIFFFIFAIQLFQPSFGSSEVPLKRFGWPFSKDCHFSARISIFDKWEALESGVRINFVPQFSTLSFFKILRLREILYNLVMSN